MENQGMEIELSEADLQEEIQRARRELAEIEARKIALRAAIAAFEAEIERRKAR